MGDHEQVNKDIDEIAIEVLIAIFNAAKKSLDEIMQDIKNRQKEISEMIKEDHPNKELIEEKKEELKEILKLNAGLDNTDISQSYDLSILKNSQLPIEKVIHNVDLDEVGVRSRPLLLEMKNDPQLATDFIRNTTDQQFKEFSDFFINNHKNVLDEINKLRSEISYNDPKYDLKMEALNRVEKEFTNDYNSVKSTSEKYNKTDFNNIDKKDFFREIETITPQGESVFVMDKLYLEKVGTTDSVIERENLSYDKNITIDEKKEIIELKHERKENQREKEEIEREDYELVEELELELER